MAALHVPPLQIFVKSDEELEKKLASKGCKGASRFEAWSKESHKAVCQGFGFYAHAVVELYSEWAGTCKSVVPTFRRIRIDKDDEAALQFLAVASDKCEFLDQAKDHRGKSEPLFLLYRNGQLKAKIEGANTPLLSAQILTLTPANADMDDLEENPMYLAWQERERIARGEVAKSTGGKKGKK